MENSTERLLGKLELISDGFDELHHNDRDINDALYEIKHQVLTAIRRCEELLAMEDLVEKTSDNAVEINGRLYDPG